MAEKLLLHLQYECQRGGIPIPWDRVVHRLSPGSSGQSAIQFAMKLREQLILEGHMVPPPVGRLGQPGPDFTRGYIQSKASRTNWVTRTVTWAEQVEDRRASLVEGDVIRGSGQYRRRQAMVARGELPDDEPIPTKRVGQKKKTSPDGKESRDTLSKARKADQMKYYSDEDGPVTSRFLGPGQYKQPFDVAQADIDLAGNTTDDGDYIYPEMKPPHDKKPILRKVERSCKDSSGHYVDSSDDENPPLRPRQGLRRPGMVTLSMSSENLARFPPGEGGLHNRAAPVVPTCAAQAFGGNTFNRSPTSKVAGIFGGQVETAPDFWYVKQPKS
jgi:hypothetical protein